MLALRNLKAMVVFSFIALNLLCICLHYIAINISYLQQITCPLHVSANNSQVDMQSKNGCCLTMMATIICRVFSMDIWYNGWWLGNKVMFMQKEILAPAGSFEAMQAAVQNGCDAVYLGGQRFGARAFANNFDNQRIVEAIRYCHRYGVRVYVTVNTLIHQDEIEATLAYIGFLHKNNVDAIIVQDYGILYAVRQRYPNLAVHASTQMHVHNVEGVQYLMSLGLTRVVLSRECSIAQIREIHQACPEIELEAFVYGAHCVSYSGQCLMSAMIGNRSGNRGECAQPCRLPYELWKERDGKQTSVVEGARYLISMKDLNTLDHIHELIDAGVYSFKIEGRMKRPEYVAKVVSVFRKAFEAYDEKRRFKVSSEDNEHLLKLFNRGFTPGHIFDQRGSDIVNTERPNHIGVAIGVVAYVHRNEKRIGIKLHQPLYQMDGIRFLGREEDDGWIIHKIYRNDLLVNQGNIGDMIEIDYRDGIEKGSKVVKTSDSKLLAGLQETFAKPSRKLPIVMQAEVRVNQPLRLQVSDGIHTVNVNSEQPCDRATNTPLSNERIQQQLSKLNDTSFVVQSIHIDNDGLSILPISQLNQLRRTAADELMKAREEAPSLDSFPYQEKEFVVSLPKREVSEPTLSCSVYTKDQLDMALACGMKRIYLHNEALYKEYSNHDAVVLSSKRVNDNHTPYPSDKLLIRELGALHTALEINKEIYIDDTMNIYNAYTVAYFQSLGAKSVALSNELSAFQLSSLMDEVRSAMDIEFNVYGRIENMLVKHCVINSCTIDTKQKDCNMCRIGDNYALRDRKNENYPLLCDQDCFTHVLHSKPLVLLDEVAYILSTGVNVLRMNFTIETAEEVKSVVNAFQNQMKGIPATLPISYTKRFFR